MVYGAGLKILNIYPQNGISQFKIHIIS